MIPESGNMMLTITKLFPSGAYECCTILHGQLVRNVYYGYTKQEARRDFMAKYAPKA